MSLRSSRVLVLVAFAGVAACVPAIVGTASPAAATARGGASGALLTHCARRVLGVESRPATPAVGSADPQLKTQFGVFHRGRSDADALPAASDLRTALAGANATSYDPSAAVRLKRTGRRTAVYAVPATLALTTLPAECARLAQFAGAGAYVALRGQETGSGPGVCLLSTRFEDAEPPDPPLPGQARAKPVRTLAVVQTVCESEPVLSGYVGVLGGLLTNAGTPLVLVPDGVTGITYALADGHRLTAPVAGNLATPPAALSVRPPIGNLTVTELGRLLTARLPATVTESGTGNDPTTTLTRPVSLIPDFVAGFSFLRRLLTVGEGAGSSSSTSGTTGASCSARTHRCVAVSITTTCDSHQHCTTSRRIYRYRYVGARPPAGTTGPDTQPTAPIIARTNRFVTRPAKLTLVLTGTRIRRVAVLLSVSCFSRHSSASAGEPPLRVPVPSRTSIALPGPGRRFSACDVGALVTSAHPGSVHVSVARD